jgi:hypothetical protein
VAKPRLLLQGNIFFFHNFVFSILCNIIQLPSQLTNLEQDDLEGLLAALIENDKEASMSKVHIQCQH